MYVVLLVLSGLLGVFVFHYLDWGLLLNGTFWITAFIEHTLYIGFFLVTVMIVYETYGNTDGEYLKMEIDIFAEKDIILSDEFKKDIINYNFNEKKYIWVQTLRTAISNFERTKNHKTHLEINTVPKEKWTKKTRKYANKHERLTNMLKNDYIEKELFHRKYFNFDLKTKFKQIKYKEITINEIIYGSTTLPTKTSKLVRNPLGRRFLHKLIVFMLVTPILSKVVFELLNMDKSTSSANVIKSLSFIILMIFVYVMAGIYNGKKAHMDRTSNASIRYGIVNNFKKGYRHKEASIYCINEIKDVA